MVSVVRVFKNFGHRHAVTDVSFDVGMGTVLGFLGPNGAGKTTTMRMITGYLRPTSGSVTVMGTPVGSDPVGAKRHIGYMPENTPLYDDMTVHGFLRFVAELRGYSGAEVAARADAAIVRCQLDAVRHQSIDTLSKGYKQRTSLAQALLHDPPVLIMDEPTEGLDPNQKHVVRDMIRQMGREKIIILSTHVLEEVEAMCSRVVIISGGRLVADSSPQEMKKRSRHFNAVTLDVVAPADACQGAFQALRDVERVELLPGDNKQQTLRLTPRDGQPIAAQALELARSRSWLVTRIQTDSGRLDDVFRSLTATEDVRKNA